MYIKNIALLNYRNYKELNLEFGKNVNVFMGNNAQGKTNILESIYYCAFAKSHRTSRDKELINWKSNDAYVSVSIAKERLDKRIDINILKDGKKAIRINKIKINKIGELFGTFKGTEKLTRDLGNSDEIQARVGQIKIQLEETSSEFDKEKLQERLAKLSGGVAVIRVGAVTETELRERKLRIEDALAATKAAVEEGIVPGGGTAYIDIINGVSK